MPQIKRCFLTLMFSTSCCMLLATRCLGASNWEDEKDEWMKIANSRVYKDPGYAAKLAMNFLPVDNGHFYVDEIKKGVWFTVGQTAALSAVAVTYLGSRSREKEDKDPIWTDAMVAAGSAGALAYVGLKVWAAFSAAEDARRYNAAQEKRFKTVRWDITPRGVQLTMRWRRAHDGEMER
jgi:hypothetical protein